jgi:hypothetical protein
MYITYLTYRMNIFFERKSGRCFEDRVDRNEGDSGEGAYPEDALKQSGPEWSVGRRGISGRCFETEWTGMKETREKGHIRKML